MTAGKAGSPAEGGAISRPGAGAAGASAAEAGREAVRARNRARDFVFTGFGG